MLPLLTLVVSFLIDAGEARPNVLLVVSDDLNCSLACYGAVGMRTPAIDALAARGVRFERAYCQFPLCNPSRASFLSGLRPDRTQIRDNARPLRTVLPDVVTLPQAFRRAGYRTVRIGKLYHYGVPAQIGTSGLDDAPSWDEVVNPRGRDKEAEPRITTLSPGQFGGTLSWLAEDGADEEFTDGVAATAAVAKLAELKDRPFFLAVGFYRPHTPYVAPKPWFAHYPLDGIVLAEPRLTADNPASVPKQALASGKAEQAAMSDDQRRQAIQAYRASISHMDSQLARVLAALDANGLAANTVVVFTSDHGYHLGEHGLWQKQSLFEESARVPLIIAGPGISAGGQACGRPAELVDLYPTLCALCRVAPADGLSGFSLLPQLRDVTAPGRTTAFTMVMRGKNQAGRSLRSERWRYTEWDDGKAGSELYDHDSDAQERRNLAGDPAHAATVAELKTLLAAERGR